MPPVSWLGFESTQASVDLTVRAQTVPLNDNGRGGQLLFDAFFPIRRVNSIRLRYITTLDFRPVSDRREWNAPGRAIPKPTPKLSELEMVPVEGYDKIDEYEMQKLVEDTLGNVDTIRQLIGVSLPTRARNITLANNRRLEVDAFSAWANGQMTARNAQTGTTQTVSFGFDAARYTSAGTAWSATNAYTALRTWIRAVQQNYVPSIGGVMLSGVVMDKVIADSPSSGLNITTGGVISGLPMMRNQVEDRLSQDLGVQFRFFQNDNTEDIFTGAGLTTARTRVWPQGKVAVVPGGGGAVGETLAAPSVRAHELSNQAPDARIDVNGQTIYITMENEGKSATIAGQINAVSVPNEQLTAVIDSGM
jgi:hypothetical protein